MSAFRERLGDTGTFDAASPGGKFAHYLYRAHALDVDAISAKAAHELIEEAQLFVDASHQYQVKRAATSVAP